MDKTYLIGRPGSEARVLVDGQYLTLLLGNESIGWINERLQNQETREVTVHTFAINRGPDGWVNDDSI